MEKLTSFARKVLAASSADERLIDEVLHPRDLFEPSSSPCMQAFVKRIEQAAAQKEKVLIAGDYDCDGILSTAIFERGLSDFNVQTGYYIPDRIQEGYGLSPRTVEMAAAKGYSLIVTCDNGVRAFEALETAKKLNIDVIVTDHHLLDQEVECAVLVHPDVLEPWFSSLCGAGVAYECLRALGVENEAELIFAAVASIADCMEVSGQTRALIQKGLAAFNAHGEIHLDPFIRRRPISERDAAFQIAPRINALGRMAPKANANTFVRYLKADHPKLIKEYASKVEEINEERKSLSALVYARAQTMINPLHPVLLAMDPSFPEGIIGLAAGSLSSHYGRPAVVCTKTSEGFKGSMRAPKGFHCLDFLCEFEGFSAIGGHAQAAGFSLEEEQWKNFEAYLKSRGRSYSWMPETDLPIDLDPDEVSIENVRALDQLRPFGNGFEMPRFRIADPRIVSTFDLSQGAHRKFVLANGVQALHFNQSTTDAAASPSRIEALIGTLSISSYRSREQADFLIEEIVYRKDR